MKAPRGQALTDLMLFIVFIVALGFLWVALGGPERAGSNEQPFFSSPFSENSGLEVPLIPVGTTTESGDSSGGSFINQLGTRLTDLQSGEERSPYAEYVSLSLSNASHTDPHQEYLTIKTARALTSELPISSWRLESTRHNKSIPLGLVTAIPRTGSVPSPSTLVVGANATVYVVSGRSPLGTSFRVNRCSGYFEQFQDFEPRLSIECPFPSETLQTAATRANFTPSFECSSFISRIPRCTLTQENLPPTIESSCYNVIVNDLTYNGCVANHQSEASFFKNEWRVYLNQDTELWNNTSERIRLIDEVGRVIDVVAY
jgi:hypothetical protein